MWNFDIGDEFIEIFLEVEADDRVEEFAVEASQLTIALHEAVEMVASHPDALENE